MPEKIGGNYTLCAIEDGSDAEPRPRSDAVGTGAAAARPRRRRTGRRRTWLLSPDGFRELRHSCFLSRKACAQFLGVSERTVRHWDAGRCRVPWSAVRLLRFVRLGDLGALDASWDGWVLNRNGLWSPDGKRYSESSMRLWWLTSEQARFWRDDYGRRAGERLEGASQGAAVQHPTGESLSCPALDMPERVASPSPATALFLLPVAAAAVDLAAVCAAARALPALDNAGVFLADSAMLVSQLPALVQGQQLHTGSILTPLCDQNGEFVTVSPSPDGPLSNTGLTAESAR